MPIKKQEITEEIKVSYLDYAMSVIVARALPDVRDGLKPVHRRILYAMHQEGLSHSAKFRKSATVVGTTLGHFHPHGDSAVYDALARMAQDFSLRYPLIEGQGNFGSIDGDPPAAQRYTECRLSKIGEELLRDIEKDTVNFVPNYDDTKKEPSVLPSPLPQLLLNGSWGIAVGMATAIPPHNLGELCDGILYLSENEDATVKDIFKFFKGPDFPTGGQIFDKAGIIKAYETGKGAILNRGKAKIIEKKKDNFGILITEIPYAIQKSSLLEEIANLVRDKKIDGIKNIRDESDRDGLRIVVEFKKDAQANKILNQLYKWTSLERIFYLNMVSLEGGIQPKTLSLKDVMRNFLAHREEVVCRRTKFELEKVKDRIHILQGLHKALLNIDAVIAIIKKSRDREDAKNKLIAKFKFSERQADVILDTRLHALARLEREKINEELEEKKKLAKKLEAILKSKKAIKKVVMDELKELKRKYGDKRKTEVMVQKVGEFKEIDLIPKEENVLILTSGGYVKRLLPSTFKSQKRGGTGVSGLSLREEDKVEHFLHLSSHDEVLFFTSLGKVFKIPAYEIPSSERQSVGRGIVNFIELSPGESITSLIDFSRQERGKFLVMTTRNGIIKKTDIKEFEAVRRSGLRAIKVEEGDELSFVRESGGKDEVFLASSNGNVIRFKEKDIRPMGRNSMGVRGMRIKKEDKIVGMDIIEIEKLKEKAKKLYLLALSENGFGKKTDVVKFRLQKRGGKGIIGMKVVKKTGSLSKVYLIENQEDLIIISEKGQTIKTKIKSVSTLGRPSQGVKLIRLKKGDKVASATTI